MKKRGFFLFILVSVFVAGCDTNEPYPAKKKTQEVSVSRTYSLQNRAWLSRKLPKNTLGYIRIPTPWNMWAERKGDVLHEIQSLKEHEQNIQRIKNGLVNVLLKHIPAEAHGLVKAIFEHVSTPLEVGFINDSETMFSPSILVGTTLDGLKFEDIQKALNQLVSLVGMPLKLIDTSSEQGEMLLKIDKHHVAMKFNHDSGKLAVLISAYEPMDRLKKILRSQRTAQELDTVLQLDKEKDPAGLGLQMWFTPSQLFHYLDNILPLEKRQTIQMLGLDKAEYFWFSSGSNNGGGELTIKLIMPESGMRLYIPRVDSVDDLETAGKPKQVFAMAFPTIEQIDEMLKQYVKQNNTGNFEVASYVDGWVDKINQHIGLDLEKFFLAYDQKVIWVDDDAGQWWALKVKNIEEHNLLIKKISDTYQLKSEPKQLNGVEIYSADIRLLDVFESVLKRPLYEDFFLSNFKSHFYWYVEGSYLIIASLPQILADRANGEDKQKLNLWLHGEHAMKWDHTILGFFNEMEASPRQIYHYYLIFLQLLADIGDTEIDMFAMPTVKDMALPDVGGYSIRLDSHLDGISLHVNYKYSVLESLSFFSSYYLYATTVVLMAYAIPAYRDYQLRAELGMKMRAASGAKEYIAKYYFSKKTLPSEKELTQSIEMPNFITYIETDQMLVIDAKSSNFNDGAAVYIKMEVDDVYDAVNFTCTYKNIKSSITPSWCL